MPKTPIIPETLTPQQVLAVARAVAPQSGALGFRALYAAHRKLGLSKAQAVAAAVRDCPEAHRAWVASGDPSPL